MEIDVNILNLEKGYYSHCSYKCIGDDKVVQEQIQQTCLKKYNYKYFTQTNEYIEKSTKTYRQKYGKDWYSQTDECLEKMKNTCQERYNCDWYSQTDEYKEKSYETRKNHKTFNSSKIEQDFKKYLENKNIKYIHQYKSKLYPYYCDFYLPDYDLYIEIQGTWTHGGHPFDENNYEDIKKINIWKSKNTKYYDCAIKNWTINDVLKRKTAKNNKLNYLEIFSSNLIDIINIFNTKMGII